MIETVYVTEHALTRYRQRAGKPDATLDDVLALLRLGMLQSRWAGYSKHPTDAWIVVAGGAFPVVRWGGELRALTFYRKRRVPAADRRAWRELQRDEMAA